MIENPNPFQLNANGLWITTLEVTNARFSAQAMPWDPVANKLAGNPSDAKRLVLLTGVNADAKALVAAVFAQIARITGKEVADVRFVRVMATDPTKPVKASAGVVGVTPAWSTDDLFTLIAGDAQLAQAMGAVYAFVQANVR